MSAINGTLYAVNSGSDKILHVIDASLNVDVDLPDASNKEGAGWGKHINGIRNWSIDISGTYEEEGSGMTPNDILAAIIPPELLMRPLNLSQHPGVQQDGLATISHAARIFGNYQGKGHLRNLIMTAINGTDVLLYCDGVVIAAQRGLSGQCGCGPAGCNT